MEKIFKSPEKGDICFTILYRGKGSDCHLERIKMVSVGTIIHSSLFEGAYQGLMSIVVC